MSDLADTVTSADGLAALYEQPTERIATKTSTMSTLQGAHSLPHRHFLYLLLEANKVSTAHRRAIDPAS